MRPRGLAAPALVAIAVAFATLQLAPAPALADAPVVTEYVVDAPPTIRIGDRFRVTIVVEADKGTRVEIAPGGIPEDVALAESARFTTSDRAGGRTETRIELVLSPFVLGDYQMPPITLRYRDPSGTPGELKTPAARLLVRSTLPSGSSPPAPRDLKPQADIGAPPGPPYELVALAGAALALAVLLLYVAMRRMRRPLPLALEEPEPEEVLGPEDAARRLLDQAGARLVEDGDQQYYYGTISRAVRTYLTDRFGFPAFALTTVELQGQMVFRGMDRWQARLVAGLLEQCDSVMYARYSPAGERADADLTAAYEIVEMSRPLEEPQEVAG